MAFQSRALRLLALSWAAGAAAARRPAGTKYSAHRLAAGSLELLEILEPPVEALLSTDASGDLATTDTSVDLATTDASDAVARNPSTSGDSVTTDTSDAIRQNPPTSDDLAATNRSEVAPNASVEVHVSDGKNQQTKTTEKKTVAQEVPSRNETQLEHVVNSNSSEETHVEQPFVTVHADASAANGTRTVEVHIASPSVIVSVYLLMFFPIAMAYVATKHYGREVEFFPVILPITLACMAVGGNLANQSLAVLMGSPMAITLIQGFSMFVVAACWVTTSEVRSPVLTRAMLRPLLKWVMTVGVFFSVYQVVDHMVSYLCTLAERTMFNNLAPPIALFLERYLLPPSYSKQVCFPSKLALSCMVLGALVFSMNSEEGSGYSRKLAAGLLMIVTMLPYRLTQRYMLVESKELPVPLLACLDGLIMSIPSGTLTVLNQEHFWDTCMEWFTVGSIAILMVLSIFTSMGSHICTLQMLRVGSATSYLVFNAVVNFIMVAVGFAFFGDPGSPLIYAGIGISLFGGVWYAAITYASLVAGKQPSADDKLASLGKEPQEEQGRAAGLLAPQAARHEGV
mmetsp:Transcript_8377/g.22440  ORF Transcript_8377/g.22440 Transcript_8377/m.22440 type:complete len:570 (-) Transcript_8377:12-1721(-)